MLDIPDIEFVPLDDPLRKLVNRDTLCATCVRLGLSAYHCRKFTRKEGEVKGFPVIVSCNGYEREMRSSNVQVEEG